MKRILLSAAIFSSLIARGEIPAGYYDALAGKSGDELKAAVKEASHPDDHTVITYNTHTWDAFPKTDVRVIDGREVWWDMYSNKLITTENHVGLDIEHSVANSWFGGKEAKVPYTDLFHLNPSDREANGKKSDNPLGEVNEVIWENGLVKLGKPKAGTAGTATKVFEPADEYKGDFARAYFYVFTAYDTETWKTDQSMFSFDTTVHLEPWAVEMLCRWAKNDPVDTKELMRNEEIYLLQHNRNPYIDYPELVDYIWGDRKGEAFTPGEAAKAIDRPAEPVFTGKWLRGVNTYDSRWWDAELIGISHDEGELWVSVNNGDWQQYGPGVSIPAAGSHGASYSLAAYTETERDGYTLRSSIARLSLTGRDPKSDDYTEARWTPVTSIDAFLPSSDLYIVRAAVNGHVMSYTGGTSSNSYQYDGGMVKSDGDDTVLLPVEAAVVRFVPSEGGKYLLEVLDPLDSSSKGYWNVMGSGNKNQLKANAGTVATVDFDADGNALIAFDGGKRLQYNNQDWRFTNYSTNQGPVGLSRFTNFIDVTTGIVETPEAGECVAIDGNNIILPEGWTLYELNGRTSSGRGLENGIYIARSSSGKAVKILIAR